MGQLGNRKGLSILEVLAALGIMTFVFVAGMEFFRASYKKQAEEQQSAAFYQGLLVFDSYLSDDNTCTGSLSQNTEVAKYTGGTVALKAIKRLSGNLFEKDVAANGIKVTDITIGPTVGVAAVTSNDNKYYMVDLSISAQTNSGKVLDNKKTPFRFVINTNKAGKFVSCYRYMPGQAYMTCSYDSGTYVADKKVAGTDYKVYKIAQELAGTRVYCLRSPQDVGTLYLCGPTGACLVEN